MLPSGSNDRLQDLQKEVLEAIACGEPLKSIADLLCLRVESLAPDVIRSILPVDVHGLVHPLVGASIGIADTQAAPSGPRGTVQTRRHGALHGQQRGAQDAR